MRDGDFIYFLKLLKLNIGLTVRLGLVLDYFVLYRVLAEFTTSVCRVGHICVPGDLISFRGELYSLRSTFHLVLHSVGILAMYC